MQPTRRQFGVAICDIAQVGEFAALGTDFWKTLSWDFGNMALRKTLQATGSYYFSTGLSSMNDVVAGSKGAQDAILIHTQLSQKLADVNLKAIETMRQKTGLPVAFGLHCSQHDVLKMALAFNPQAIFFYVKENIVEGLFDDEHALAIDGLRETLLTLKLLEQTIGTGLKEDMKKPDWVV